MEPGSMFCLNKKWGLRSSQSSFLVLLVDVDQQVDEPVGGPGSAGRGNGWCGFNSSGSLQCRAFAAAHCLIPSGLFRICSTRIA